MPAPADPITRFTDAFRNPMTKQKYLPRLDMFFEFLQLGGKGREGKAKTFVRKSKDKKWLNDCIMSYLRMQKGRVEKKEISVSTLPNYYKPIKLFCEMNDLENVNWKRILKTLPKGRSRANDRAPSLEEMRKIIDYPDRRIKGIVFVMSSCGMRLGGWENLRWGDIEPIRDGEKILAAKITVYRGDIEEYFTFISPEAYEELEAWMNFRASQGEVITEDSWVMRNLWESTAGPNGGRDSAGLATNPIKLQPSGVKRLLERAWWAQGVRKKLESSKKRHSFKAVHGFRKFFKTAAESQMKTLHVEMLLGHDTGLSENYYRPTENLLMQDYLKAIPSLTISESESGLAKEAFEEVEKIKNEKNELAQEVSSHRELLVTLTKKVEEWEILSKIKYPETFGFATPEEREIFIYKKEMESEWYDNGLITKEEWQHGVPHSKFAKLLRGQTKQATPVPQS